MKIGDLVQYARDVHTGVYTSSDWGYGIVTEAYLKERTVEVFWPSRGTSRTTHPEYLEVISESR
jgi:hypothetical protein